MRRTARAGLTMLVVAMAVAAAAAVQAQTAATMSEKGKAEVTTRDVTGLVVRVEGDDLVVKLASGEIKTIRVPADGTCEIDGATVPVRDVKPGTLLTATITTKATPVTLEGPGAEVAAGTKVVGTAPVPASPAGPTGTPGAQASADTQPVDFEGEEVGGPILWIAILLVVLVFGLIAYKKLSGS